MYTKNQMADCWRAAQDAMSKNNGDFTFQRFIDSLEIKSESAETSLKEANTTATKIKKKFPTDTIEEIYCPVCGVVTGHQLKKGRYTSDVWTCVICDH